MANDTKLYGKRYKKVWQTIQNMEGKRYKVRCAFTDIPEAFKSSPRNLLRKWMTQHPK